MKKAVFISALLIFNLKVTGQDFSFKMTFIDAIGNTDTLIIGYDTDATDSVDADFGEVNIIDNELDSVFDVRITNELKIRAWFGYEYKTRYHLKKQIVKSNCIKWADPVSIDIKCKYWPVTAKWDSSLFADDPCREGSVFTSLSPGSWWDIATPSDLFYRILSDNDEVTFTSNANEYFYPGDFGEDSYINSNHDTIPVFWVAIGTAAIGLHIDHDLYDNTIVLSPNPSHDYISFYYKIPVIIKNIEIFNTLGKNQDINIQDNAIDISKLSKGVYFARIRYNENRIIVKKLIKN